MKEYAERLYEPAARGHVTLATGGGKKASELSKWKNSIRTGWPQISIRDVQIARDGGVYVGDALQVSATVHLGPIAPEFVTVQAYVGETTNNLITRAATIDLPKARSLENGSHLYQGTVPARESGSYGLNVRVIPTHPNLIQAHELRLITWAR